MTYLPGSAAWQSRLPSLYLVQDTLGSVWTPTRPAPAALPALQGAALLSRGHRGGRRGRLGGHPEPALSPSGWGEVPGDPRPVTAPSSPVPGTQATSSQGEVSGRATGELRRAQWVCPDPAWTKPASFSPGWQDALPHTRATAAPPCLPGAPRPLPGTGEETMAPVAGANLGTVPSPPASGKAKARVSAAALGAEGPQGLGRGTGGHAAPQTAPRSQDLELRPHGVEGGAARTRGRF